VQNLLLNIWRDEKGGALNTVLLLAIILSVSILILLASHLYQQRFILSTAKTQQMLYHNESRIVEALALYQTTGRASLTESALQWQRLACGDSVWSSQKSWGVFHRINSMANRGSSLEGIRATVGFRTTSHFYPSLIIPPLRQALIVCEDTRLMGDVTTSIRGVKSQHLRGIPYSGSKPVYGRLTASATDVRPSINQSFLQDLLRHYRELTTLAPRLTFETLMPDSTGFIRLPKNDTIFEWNCENTSVNPTVIEGPGRLLISGSLDAFKNQKLTIRDEVELFLEAPTTLPASITLQNVILFSEHDVILSGIKAQHMQILSTASIDVAANSVITGCSVLLSLPESDKTSIHFSSGTTFEGSVCLINIREEMPEWYNHIRIDSQSRVTGLAYSDWFIEHSGHFDGCMITERFHFYLSPTHYFNWIRNGVIRRTSRQISGIPLFFDLPKDALVIIFQEAL